MLGDARRRRRRPGPGRGPRSLPRRGRSCGRRGSRRPGADPSCPWACRPRRRRPCRELRGGGERLVGSGHVADVGPALGDGRVTQRGPVGVAHLEGDRGDVVGRDHRAGGIRDVDADVLLGAADDVGGAGDHLGEAGTERRVVHAEGQRQREHRLRLVAEDEPGEPAVGRRREPVGEPRGGQRSERQLGQLLQRAARRSRRAVPPHRHSRPRPSPEPAPASARSTCRRRCRRQSASATSTTTRSPSRASGGRHRTPTRWRNSRSTSVGPARMPSSCSVSVTATGEPGLANLAYSSERRPGTSTWTVA